VTALDLAIPTTGDPGPGWADDLVDGLEKIERASEVSLDAYVWAAGGAFDGVFNCDVPIAAAIAAVPSGGVIKVRNPGICSCSPTAWNVTKTFTLQGPPTAGEYAWWIKPTADVAVEGDPIIFLDPPAPSGTVRAKYGPAVENVGIDMSGLTKAVGVSIGTGAHWARIKGLYTSGGWRGWECHGPNAKIDGFNSTDPVDCGWFVDDDGLETEVLNGTTARNIAGTTDAYFKVHLSSGGQKGDLKVKNIRGTCSLGSAVVNKLFEVSAPVLTGLPCFMEGVILDNAEDGADITNIQDFGFKDGWMNCAAGSGFCFNLDGCLDPVFEGNRYLGGFGGGTYRFIGATTDGFTSKNNKCPTGPVYWVSPTNKPTNIDVDDDIKGASVLAQVTNDVDWFAAASRLDWSAHNFRNLVAISGAVPILQSPMIAVGTMVAGEVTIDAPGVDPALTNFIPFVVTRGGTTGSLSVSNRNPTGGTGGLGSVTIVSSSASDTSTIGYLRFDIG
jgi:hypothetical protein